MNPSQPATLSLAAQLQALLQVSAEPDSPATATVSVLGVSKTRRTAHADALRLHVLRQLAAGPLTIVGINATRPDITYGNWAWIVKTLTELGFIRRTGRGHHHTALLYEITPSGRDHLAATTAITGDH